ncbi:MAG: glycoside hydrolase family 97 protein [Prevotella sp.]|nr:glycoside hydrolase family 97 protein [Prevotella sp.]MCM1074979.1 glycoside hydrolase family 97 protein [Ruminococcus sp.]
MKQTLSAILLCSCACAAYAAGKITSPDGHIAVITDIDADSHPVYSVSFNGKPVLNNSTLGLKSQQADFSTVSSMLPGKINTYDSTWEPVWGEFASIRDHYNEMPVELVTPDGKKLTVRFRVYNDGVAFRYEIPEQQNVNYLAMSDELTEFNLADDLTLFCIPGDYDTDERLYTITPMSQLGSNMQRINHTEASGIPGLAVQTPLLAKNDDSSLYINIHEAALKGYPAMALDADTATLTLKAHLTPDRNGVRGYVQAPFSTPWRTVIIADNAPDILASQLILNLNEPSAIEDTSWIKPMKFVGVWWEMFVGKDRTWAYSDKYNAKPGITDYSKLPSNGRHPANTENVKRYIDFAAANGIDGVLVEGWNEGWEDWAGWVKDRQFLFDKPYPDFDVDEIQQYANSKGVKMIMHHETAANAADYERQLQSAFKFMNAHNYPAVKTGYVGHIIPRSEYHSSQWMVDHYIYVAEEAAKHKIMVDSHEAVRPTGLCRTYPNWIAQESARGGEFESMGGNPPEHTTILPFTRLKGGPMDYTPGLFEPDLSTYGEGKTGKGQTTLARQLALYVTMASPLQMAMDLPENYKRFPEAFRFIREVPLDWADSKWLEAEPGEYITVARLDKNSNDWYIGGVTDEKSRTANIDLSFLTPGKKYTATIWEDAPDAHYQNNQQAYRIRTVKVTNKSKLKQKVAPGGGFAIQLRPE